MRVSLKWPNDVLSENQKIGGILCESKKSESAGAAVIVGIGMNINSGYEDFPEDLKKSATSLAIMAGYSFDRHRVLAICLSKLEHLYELLEVSDLQTIRSGYVSRCSTLGKQVRINTAKNQIVEGIASGIGNDGELKLLPIRNAGDPEKKDSTPIFIRAGEVIHLR